jgi:hypothetical protein
MKGFAILLLLLIVFAGGLYVGGSLGVTGKPNDVYLQTDYTYGVIPYFNQGDRIHFFDPNKDLINGQFAAVDDVYVVSPTNPCKNLDANGICEISVPSGTYKYKCQRCGDPTFPIGTGGPVNGAWGGDQGDVQGYNRSPMSLPGSSAAAFFTLGAKQPASRAEALATLYPYNSLYAKIARAFVADFFTPAIKPNPRTHGHEPTFTQQNSGIIQAVIDCDSNHQITVESPNLWYPGTTMPILLNTRLTWTRQTGFPSTTSGKPLFTVQDLPGSTDFATACGGPLDANQAGTTKMACMLGGPASARTIRYTITDPTNSCKAPADGFSINVVPAPGTVVSTPIPAGTVPGLR